MTQELVGKLAICFLEKLTKRFITKNEIDKDVGGLHIYLGKYLKSASSFWCGPLILLVTPQSKSGQIEYKGFVQLSNKLFKDTFVGFQPVDVQIELINERFSSGKRIGNINKVQSAMN